MNDDVKSWSTRRQQPAGRACVDRRPAIRDRPLLPSRAGILTHRIAACATPDYGATRIHILAPGTENDYHNPPRTTSRHIINLAIGTENLFHTERLRTTIR